MRRVLAEQSSQTNGVHRYDAAYFRLGGMSGFEEYCERADMRCIGQELVNWGTKRLIDCFSVFTLRRSRWARANKIIRNGDFMREAEMIRRSSELYNFT